MMKAVKLTAALLAWLALGGRLQAMEHSVSFGLAEVLPGKSGEFDMVAVPGLPLDNRPGAPMLPVKYLHLLLPPGARAVSVEVVRSDEKRMDGEFLPPPGRGEAPLSEKPTMSDPVPDRSIYGSPETYPASQAELVHQGSMGGLGVATLKVYPVRYRGAERSLLRSTEVEISLRLAHGKNSGFSAPSGAVREMAGRLAGNRQHLDAWYPRFQKETGKNGSADLLIITGAPFDTVLLRLADWKQSRGLVSIIAATDSIYSNVTGFDRQEKIRNFIRERVQNSGVSYVILGGDTAVVPARVAYAMASGYDSLAPGRDSLRADLYYSDLDGTWDANGNGLYGELADSVDMYPDVIVGRAPINTVADAQTFVRKVMEYEQGAMSDFLDRASLWAEMLDYETDGSAAAQILDRDHLTPYFKPAEKLYETLGNQTRASTIEAYRQGRHITNHVGHAWYTSLNVGPGFTGVHEIRAGDFDTIPTGGRWGIIYSIGCMPAAIERSCLAERYVNSPQGGGAAFIGNCSYGWYLPFFAGYASSDLFNQQFFQDLLIEDTPSLGSAHAAAKAHFIGAAQAGNEYRWVMYSLNLIGDPTLAVWTDNPESLEVVCPDSLRQGEASLEATVLLNGQPLSGAAVTLAGDSAYSRGSTDLLGRVSLAFVAAAGDTLRLAAGARNCLPAARRIPVYAIGAQVSILGWQATEISGNGDGLPGPGEELGLSFLVKNTGSEALGDSLSFILTPSDSTAAMLDSSFRSPAPAPGESLWTGALASFRSDSGLADGEVVSFNLSVSAQSGTAWSFPAAVRLSAPLPAFAGYRVDDRAGNGNGVPEPGEEFDIYVNIANRGKASAQLCAILTTADPFISVNSGADTLGIIAPDSTGTAAFRLSISQDIPGPSYLARLSLAIQEGWMSWQDSFAIIAGTQGFSDDMETGAPGWRFTPSGTGNARWHLSSIRSHSPGHSWYFGDETDSLMPQYSVDTLETPPFVTGPSCSLGWWQWHDFLPGWSWGVVEVCGDFGARLLEVVEGLSGGWSNRVYDLSRYPPGTVLSLRFIGVCDSVRSEGWYLDDVNVFGPPTGAAGEPPSMAGQPFALHPPRPNPARDRTVISFSVPHPGQTGLKVYNVQGQLVRDLTPPRIPYFRGEGSVGSVAWDCRDGSGRAVASGLYIVRLSTGVTSVTRKLTVIR